MSVAPLIPDRSIRPRSVRLRPGTPAWPRVPPGGGCTRMIPWLPVALSRPVTCRLPAAIAHAGAPDVDAPSAIVVGLAPRDRDVVRGGANAGPTVADRDGAADPATGESGPDAAGTVRGGDGVRQVVVPSPHDEPVAAIAR